MSLSLLQTVVIAAVVIIIGLMGARTTLDAVEEGASDETPASQDAAGRLRLF
jgi:hypothetical protein